MDPSTTRTIYLVDDDEAVRDSFCVLLQGFGMEVLPFESAEAFLAAGPIARSACLVFDHHMPGMTGLDLLELLRANGNDTPAIIITGRADRVVQERARSAGVTALLDKPVDADTLLRAIKAAHERGKPRGDGIG
jgi:two-component system response regulator FixJ